jgi:hypothetical protein
MRLLNIYKNYIVHYMFRPSLVIIRCFKIVRWRLLCLLSSNVGCEVTSHIRVFVVLRVFSCRVVCLVHECVIGLHTSVSSLLPDFGSI